jgi:chromate transporter
MSDERTSLASLAALFFRLGATSFGGPAAHTAMMHREVVARRKWLSEERFLDLMGAVNLIPGPNSTELAMHVGHERRGFGGLLVAGAAFIVPAMAITAAMGWAYVKYRAIPAVGGVLYGVKPVMVAVVLQAIWALAPKAAKSPKLRALAAVSVGLCVAGVHELAVIVLAGLAHVGMNARPQSTSEPQKLSQIAPVLPVIALSASAQAVTLPSLFAVFAKTGAVLFGSGYVLLAFLRADLVHRLRWLTEAQLMDAIAVGQVTPGPVFTTATFIGYVLAGPWGAIVATVGIFLPAFVFVAVSGPLVRRVRSSARAGAFLDGVNVASLALMLVVTAQLAQASVVDGLTAALVALSLAALVRFELNATWLIAAGAIVGAIVRR